MKNTLLFLIALVSVEAWSLPNQEEALRYAARLRNNAYDLRMGAIDILGNYAHPTLQQQKSYEHLVAVDKLAWVLPGIIEDNWDMGVTRIQDAYTELGEQIRKGRNSFFYLCPVSEMQQDGWCTCKRLDLMLRNCEDYHAELGKYLPRALSTQELPNQELAQRYAMALSRAARNFYRYSVSMNQTSSNPQLPSFVGQAFSVSSYANSLSDRIASWEKSGATIIGWTYNDTKEQMTNLERRFPYICPVVRSHWLCSDMTLMLRNMRDYLTELSKYLP